MCQYLSTLNFQVTSITKDIIWEGISGNYPAYNHWAWQIDLCSYKLDDQMLRKVPHYNG